MVDSPVSHIVEGQPRVLDIMATLPKGLRKKDNIKASLRQHLRGGGTAAAQDCGQQRIRGRNEDVPSCPLPHPQSWKTRGKQEAEGSMKGLEPGD